MTAPDPGIKADYITVHGSRCYGLDNKDSDWDFKGFFLPEPRHILGYRQGPEQRMCKDDVRDTTAWDIRKFFRLAADCNPNVIETLYTGDGDVVVSTAESELVRKNRHLFLSRRIRDSFGGYAVSQLKKVRTGDWNDPRCRKDAMHLARLTIFGAELLERGVLHMNFNDPDFGDDTLKMSLLSIRSGLVSRETVIEKAEQSFDLMDEALKGSRLPAEPDHEALTDLLQGILRRHLEKSRG